MRNYYVKDQIRATLDEIENDLNENQEEQLNGISTGFPELDQWLRGFKPGELTMIAAAPFIGKSELAINMVERLLAGNEELSIAYFLGNKSQKAIINQLAACRARVNPISIVNRDLSHGETKRVGYAIADLKRHAPKFFGSSQADIAEVILAVLKLHTENALDLIVVDKLQDIYGPNSQPGWEATLSKLKEVASILDVPIIVLCTIFEAHEERDCYIPTGRDVRDTVGSLESIDNLILLYRDEVYNEGSEEKGRARLIITKNSEIGTTHGGCILMRFDLNAPFYN